jgi:hypothetical protein
MTGAVNPYAAKKPKQQNNENTNEQQPTNQPDGSSAVSNAIAGNDQH